MRDLSGYCNRHGGETAYLYGKGISFEQHDRSKDGPLRVCVNDTSHHVEDATYLFMHQQGAPQEHFPIEEMIVAEAVAKSPRIVTVLQSSLSEMALRHTERVVSYEKEFRYIALDRDHIRETNSLFARICTASSAIHFLHYAGVHRVEMIGFDGIYQRTRYDRLFPLCKDFSDAMTEQDGDYAGARNIAYRRSRQQIENLGHALGMQLIFTEA